jgi:hypothetical protein
VAGECPSILLFVFYGVWCYISSLVERWGWADLADFPIPESKPQWLDFTRHNQINPYCCDLFVSAVDPILHPGIHDNTWFCEAGLHQDLHLVLRSFFAGIKFCLQRCRVIRTIQSGEKNRPDNLILPKWTMNLMLCHFLPPPPITEVLATRAVKDDKNQAILTGGVCSPIRTLPFTSKPRLLNCSVFRAAVSFFLCYSLS